MIREFSLKKGDQKIPFPYILKKGTSFEENVIAWADFYEKEILPGNGLFFDFDQVPEFGNALLNWLINFHGWTMDYDDQLVRKPLVVKAKHNPKKFKKFFPVSAKKIKSRSQKIWL